MLRIREEEIHIDTKSKVSINELQLTNRCQSFNASLWLSEEFNQPGECEAIWNCRGENQNADPLNRSAYSHHHRLFIHAAADLLKSITKKQKNI
uniref:Uncharacterized protein n=1 Tax=Macrostomum lignano TaxID=282301 RepID=A0A1I8JLM1_9PLAT